MKPSIFLVLFSFCVLSSTAAQKQGWEEMLEKSEVVALIEYTEDGNFRAPATILKIYHGKIGKNDLWIDGFSDPAQSNDPVKPGDRFIVFLKPLEPSAKVLEHWEAEVHQTPSSAPFLEAIKARKAYQIWSSTAGHLKVDGNEIRYDLRPSAVSSGQSYHSLTEFEGLLKAFYSDKPAAFHRKIQKRLQEENGESMRCHYLRMLLLSGCTEYLENYSLWAKEGDPEVAFTIAQLLGQTPEKEAQNLLVHLLDHESLDVQLEAVQQLTKFPPQFFAPILLSYLPSADEIDWDPIQHITQREEKIIRTLGALHYRAAEKSLLPLLETEDQPLFTLVLETLQLLESEAYAPYLVQHLKRGTTALIPCISSTIAQRKIRSALPALKEYITSTNREKAGSAYLISTEAGLGAFSDTSTQQFVLRDLKHFLSHCDTLNSELCKDWFNAYLNTFSTWKLKEANPLVFDLLYNWYGFNKDFGHFPGLFDSKRAMEDSLQMEFTAQFGSDYFQINSVSAYLTNSKEAAHGHPVEAQFRLEVQMPGNENGAVYRTNISQMMAVPEDRVFVRYVNGNCLNTCDDRLNVPELDGPMLHFLSYAAAVPSKENLAFLKALQKNCYADEAYMLDQIRGCIGKTERALGQESQ